MKKHLNSKKIILLIFTPILLTLAVVGFAFGISFNKAQHGNNVSQPNNVDVEYTLNKIYLVDSENTLVPLTIKHESFATQGEELMYLLNAIKVDSIYANATFNGLLPKDSKVLSLTLNDKKLNINFDDGFKEYEAANELRLLESLTWTFCDLPYVESISLSLNDQLLSNMPNKNTPLSAMMDKTVGINKYLLTTSILGSGTQVLSYYEKKINDQYYYVPVTHHVSNKDNLSIYDLTINTLLTSPGITSNLNVCRCLSESKIVSQSILTDNILYVSLSEDILFDEVTVSLDVYQIIKESTSLIENVKDVAFLMDLEEVKVNGIEDEETMVVSTIELNKYYI